MILFAGCTILIGMLAIGIVSGGLDSLLSVRLVQRMGFEVIALHFVCGFESAYLRRRIENRDARAEASAAIRECGARVEVVDLRQAFLPVLADPPHGYGANLNPCIDCKILMLREARTWMQQEQAAFVFTGEVLGQRPMSQRLDTLSLIARESGLGDFLLRPLSGRLLPETEPERAGHLRREQLEDIQGRGRKRQMELASAWGITNYPSPAGGCLLTDPAYSDRAREVLARRPNRLLRLDDPLLLLVGRHIVLPGGAKAVIGRNQQENGVIETFAPTGFLLEAADVPGPVTLVEGHPSAMDCEAAARLTARYGKGRTQAQVMVHLKRPDGRVEDLASLPVPPEGCRML